jgi:hypothetical protein
VFQNICQKLTQYSPAAPSASFNRAVGAGERKFFYGFVAQARFAGIGSNTLPALRYALAAKQT